jgi:hypothetical protein
LCGRRGSEEAQVAEKLELERLKVAADKTSELWKGVLLGGATTVGCGIAIAAF